MVPTAEQIRAGAPHRPTGFLACRAAWAAGGLAVRVRFVSRRRPDGTTEVHDHEVKLVAAHGSLKMLAATAGGMRLLVRRGRPVAASIPSHSHKLATAE